MHPLHIKAAKNDRAQDALVLQAGILKNQPMPNDRAL